MRTVLAKLEDSPWYHVTYLEGLLEVMSPSRRYERSKTQIGMFLEAYFQQTLTPFWGLALGSSYHWRMHLCSRISF